MAGRLVGIARRGRSRAPMEALPAVAISVAAGLEGDARGRPGRRQVTVLAREDWAAAMRDAAGSLPWTARRANLLIEGLALADCTGAELRIGKTVRLRISGETDPCARMDAALPGLRAALTPGWRGGVTCRVVADGEVAVGDPVLLVVADAPQGPGPVAGAGRPPV
jgi:MOSC domain-containing protein YiiM